MLKAGELTLDISALQAEAWHFTAARRAERLGRAHIADAARSGAGAAEIATPPIARLLIGVARPAIIRARLLNAPLLIPAIIAEAWAAIILLGWLRPILRLGALVLLLHLWLRALILLLHLRLRALKLLLDLWLRSTLRRDYLSSATAALLLQPGVIVLCALRNFSAHRQDIRHDDKRKYKPGLAPDIMQKTLGEPFHHDRHG
ncbi:MAG: hypothetical protein K2P80_07310 [Beijerinckiaceae bacterium]|nr:hypothetical protein [Beijerinckiaceae bacterium]